MTTHTDSTATQTTYQRYQAVVADLATQGITLVFDTWTVTADDAWTEAVRRHGNRVTVTDLYRGRWTAGRVEYDLNGRTYVAETLWFSHPHDDPAVGHAVADAFTRHGFAIDWNGSPWRSIAVTVATA